MQVKKDYSWFPLTLLWFGASMSVAEMQTGGLMSAAGLSSGLAALFGGHILGALLLGLMGYLGYKERMPSIMCTRISFGRRGSWVLSMANVLQLVGWTAAMIQLNSQTLGGITRILWDFESAKLAVLALACLVALWTFWETQGKHSGNAFAVILLACLGLLTTWLLWQQAGQVNLESIPAPAEPISFGAAFELSLVMPLSWFPLVADYACRAKSARAACLGPALGYFIGSVWMYGVGFAGALLTGESSPTPMLMAAGLGVAALSVLVFSTVVTTFLDVYSAVASARNIAPKLPERPASFVVVLIGGCAAMFWSSDVYVDFLHCIGAVFAPLSAILFSDYFLLRRDEREKAASIPGLVSLVCGIASYWTFSYIGTPIGPTLSCLLFTLVIHAILRLLQKRSAVAVTGA
ncbi:putative hydroxymethylpyrimidine transporter CytX [Desulfovibrio sp. OttesenSCG-928-C06]|nr:putative hydroxymethylpyrimidine transporter CytX [Desulfovibrio sp. OttesenSCG-928-C06]